MSHLGIATRSRSENGLRASPYRELRHDFDGNLHVKAYMLGFCKGDVHAWVRDENSQTIRLMTSTTKIEQIELFRDLFSTYGRVYISNRDRRGAIHMSAFVNMSLDFLLDKKDEIPEWALSQDELFFAFFAGYADAEGYIGIANGYALFKIDSYEKNILFQSCSMLNKIGITCPAPWICTKQGYVNKNGHPYHQDLWRLSIAGKSALLSLFERIKSYLRHQIRIRQMQDAITSIQVRNGKKHNGRNGNVLD